MFHLWRFTILVLSLCFVLQVGCQRNELPFQEPLQPKEELQQREQPQQKEATTPTERPSQVPDTQAPPETVQESQTPEKKKLPGRLVAFGDVHGDLNATRRVLHLLGAIDEKDKWIGGNLRVVSTGDQLDRGDQERAILDLLDRLQKEAKAAGGQFLILNGNHEVMNVAWDFRYVTPGGWKDFQNIPGLQPSLDPALAKFPLYQRPRAQVFQPGGLYAKILAKRPIIAIVDDTIFVHGGVLPQHVDYGIEKIVRDLRVHQILEGTNEIMRVVISRKLLSD